MYPKVSKAHCAELVVSVCYTHHKCYLNIEQRWWRQCLLHGCDVEVNIAA